MWQDVTVHVHRFTPPSVEVCVPLPLGIVHDLVWLAGIHTFPVAVYPVVQLDTGEVQSRVFPTTSLIAISQVSPMFATVQVPPAIAIQLSRSVLPVRR